MKISPFQFKQTIKPNFYTTKNNIDFRSKSSTNEDIIDLADPNSKSEQITWEKFSPERKLKFKHEIQMPPIADSSGYMGRINSFNFEYLTNTIREIQWFQKPRPPIGWFNYAHKNNPEKNPDYETYVENLKKEAQNEISKQIHFLDGLEGCKYPHIFYRGVKLTPSNDKKTSEISQAYCDYMKNAQIGDIIIPDWHQTFATTDIRTALQYSDEAILIIRTKPKAKFYLQKCGEVAIFPPKSKFKVLSKKTQQGIQFIELEHIVE